MEWYDALFQRLGLGGLILFVLLERVFAANRRRAVAEDTQEISTRVRKTEVVSDDISVRLHRAEDLAREVVTQVARIETRLAAEERRQIPPDWFETKVNRLEAIVERLSENCIAHRLAQERDRHNPGPEDE